uniref:Endolytic murein transglycosylase n=1 Tax=Candidatus Kentrum sp. FM TaxID=2126340 RepID=A0A450TLJ4_9GAMM|nr:MAG: UPF0755 protein [Candidatus Kentron sp. FM]VFJ69008.1 MAG: UPF0755 protein [Candidatus Kentron sp. FM]VFK17565.1 MAG: UPF0755 protein [Candidatus Kentron sp. FM]
MSRKTTLLLFGVLLLLAAALTAGWLAMERTRVLEGALSIGDEPILLVVSPGMSLQGIARELSGRGVLSHPRYLVWEARWQGSANRIKAGEYRLEPGLTPRRLLDRLVRGKVLQRSLTIVEGWNFTELMAAVRASEYLTHTLEDDSAHGLIMERLDHPGQHPEGRFFPDTYHFPRGTTDIAFLQRAHTTMAKRLAAQWRQKAEGLPYRTPDEALILASIIEKETGKLAEVARVAGVFVRRLQRGMRLQSDPTVIYGMGTAFTGNIRRADLTRPTPYNTYTIRRLPPTPIAMPGEAAIHAALHPAPGKELYFVAKGDGGHQFSATLVEHNRAVARYQLRRKRRKKSQK